MSEVEKKEIEISQEELNKLPKDTIYCFPAWLPCYQQNN